MQESHSKLPLSHVKSFLSIYLSTHLSIIHLWGSPTFTKTLPQHDSEVK